MGKRASWGTKLGFYLVAIGSPCGLGSLWRFPYVVGENGGGAFVLLYALMVLIIGLPLLVGELILGKSTGKSILTATSGLEFRKKRPFGFVGKTSVALCILILAYYTVISGWVLHFAIQFLMAALQVRPVSEFSTLSVLFKNGFLQVGLASVHMLFCVVVVLKGVQEGLEKFIGWTVPVFAVLLLILMIRSLSLPSAENALRFLFYPDFSKLTYLSLGRAVGQVLFTLSLGFGTMVTFGSYMTGEHIPAASFRVAVIDTVVSIISGLVIFPIALQASNVPLRDPGLLFEVLPKFLLEMPGGLLFGFTFFVCLYLAALGASFGILEGIVSNFVDEHKVSRAFAAWSIGLFAWILGFIPAFSGSLLQNLQIGKKGILEFIDSVVVNWVLPVIAITVAVAITHGMRSKEKEDLFLSGGNLESAALYSHWQGALKWLVPIVISAGLILQVIGLLVH